MIAVPILLNGQVTEKREKSKSVETQSIITTSIKYGKD
ncbi:hypothetical protein M670_04048 [Schinkia azotoformans MEV2011]|uniref:Uncharacterized protein n=1 Tax=Schinkia azotoformans MEV2011 TaxID=1348973 RepID=A0A072NGZ2_SCHAZ|nr:hypothetical protein M670_04048 [Schinkia azotoformans MEV2011]